jgi:hypothetical protein
MTSNQRVVAAHGIWNRLGELAPLEASVFLADRWGRRLADGYRAAGLTENPPDITAVYYAHLLADQAQGPQSDLGALTADEKQMAWAWMRELGVPDDMAQGVLTLPLRQGLSWIAQKRGRTGDSVGRVMTAVLREVYRYLTRQALRRRIREAVIAAVEEHQPTVLVAHSLGSVVAYEALHQRPDLKVATFLTLGSPLGMPGTVFEALDPEPVAGHGVRPPGARKWVNVADKGDLVAVPVELGGRFDVDRHVAVSIGFADFHTFGGYLSSASTAKIIREGCESGQ